MLRGIFDQEHLLPLPGKDDLLARAEIAWAELVRWLRREEDKATALAGRDAWDAAFLRGYAEGREATAQSQPLVAPVKPSAVAPPRHGYVCAWCREAVAEEVSGFDLDEQGVAAALGNEEMLDNLARELGADIPGHRCEARTGLGTCACGCSIWREERRRA